MKETTLMWSLWLVSMLALIYAAFIYDEKTSIKDIHNSVVNVNVCTCAVRSVTVSVTDEPERAEAIAQGAAR